ncbi:MAG: hypothetical protein WC782_02325 [Methylococcaceae bacterium]
MKKRISMLPCGLAITWFFYCKTLYLSCCGQNIWFAIRLHYTDFSASDNQTLVSSTAFCFTPKKDFSPELQIGGGFIGCSGLKGFNVPSAQTVAQNSPSQHSERIISDSTNAYRLIWNNTRQV